MKKVTVSRDGVKTVRSNGWFDVINSKDSLDIFGGTYYKKLINSKGI